MLTLEHDPEKWERVFGKDHAKAKSWGAHDSTRKHAVGGREEPSGQRLGAIDSTAERAGATLREAGVGLRWPQKMVRMTLKTMRCGPFLMMLALLVGASPALAQPDAAAVAPYPIEPAAKHKTTKRHHAARRPAHTTKAAVAKPAAAHGPLPTATSRTAITKAALVKQGPAKAKFKPAKAKTAKSEPAKTATAKADIAEPATAAPAPDASALTDIPVGERMKIEQELFWSGDYTGTAGGNDPMEAAIRKFQKRNKAKVTGTLTAEQRADLLAAADRHVREYGWRVVVDPATGVRIGLPTKLMPNAHDAAHGTRWSSAHGEVQVETFRIKNAKLAAVFEQQKGHPKSRHIERSVLNDDGFFISGMQGLKYFSVRAKERDGEVRGFTLLYDQMMEGIVAPVVVAMSSAFSPFPERPAPFAALAKKVEYGTGLIVSADGHIVTARKVADGCQVIVADGLGNADRIAEDQERGLALLRVYGVGKLPVLALPRAAPKAGDITLIGIPDPKEQDGRKKLTEIKARLADDRAIQLRQPMPIAGFSGAAALDSDGQFLGMMETRNFVLASADAAVPPVRLVSADSIRVFLEKHHVATAEGKSGDARDAAVRIICVRK